MNKFFLKMFMSINSFMIHISKGKLGGKLGTQTILVIHYVGRKTGKKYNVPIAYFKADNGYFVVASNWGQEKNAAWYTNLKYQPDVTIEVEGKTIAVVAREVDGDEYARLWDSAVSRHPDYLHYKEMTARHIPIMVFEQID
jgi:deazaflavin-dependent oxidoreductase (nitroreductase family)